MFDNGFVFDLISGDCLDKSVVPFNSRIPIWQFPGGINALVLREKIFIILRNFSLKLKKLNILNWLIGVLFNHLHKFHFFNFIQKFVEIIKFFFPFKKR